MRCCARLILHIVGRGMLTDGDAADERLAGAVPGPVESGAEPPAASADAAARAGTRAGRCGPIRPTRARCRRLARRAGLSVRTVQRIFQDETAMRFVEWRRRLRLIHAITALSGGANVTQAGAAARLCEHERVHRRLPPADGRDAVALCEAQAAVMYSRKETASRTVSSMRVFTTSPIETMPVIRPLSSTGTWRNRPMVIISMMSWTVSVSAQVATARVMYMLTGRASAVTAAVGDRAHHVALRQDAGEHAGRIAHHDGADAFAREQARGPSDNVASAEMATTSRPLVTQGYS